MIGSLPFRLGSTLVKGLGGALAVAMAVLGAATALQLREPPESLPPPSEAVRAQILDRAGRPLSRTYQNAWNLHDRVALHEVPPVLRRAFVEAEDRRFFEHRGVDWWARLHAVVQNLRARRVVRGASTITEQAVRLLEPRRRTPWSRWMEGFEARRLERRFGKGEILEFYLNQVPYARQRRGVVQSARDYFDRDLQTLSVPEQLALVVLVRSPSRFDLRRSREPALRRMRQLAQRLHAEGVLDDEDLAEVAGATLELTEPKLQVRAPHFARFARAQPGVEGLVQIRTTLDATLQRRARRALERQIELLADRQVGDGAALVVDHRTDEVLAWVNAGAFDAGEEGSQLDAVLARRQPGSTLKPFVYALAMERGWTAATLIEDAPFERPVGRGQHAFRNYSGRFYGPLRLRDALGNSLNIPAVRAAAAVTPARLLDRLQALGFDSLDRHPDFYGEGLALGNGEVTLLELVSAYASLARGGVYRRPRILETESRSADGRRVFDPEVSSLVADILSDADARRLEFSRNGILTLPSPTAVKTGTSNDYRDAWAVGFTDRHTVGVWMGNLDLREMLGVSGAIGPAVVLRSIFAELGRGTEARSLFLSPRLARSEICSLTGSRPVGGCPTTTEWFRPGRTPQSECELHGSNENRLAAAREGPRLAAPRDSGPGSHSATAAERLDAPRQPVRLAQPSPGLELARDPRIPDHLEAFPFEVRAGARIARVEWLVDGRSAGVTGLDQRTFLWLLESGRHLAQARVWTEASGEPVLTELVAFYVK